MSAARRVITAPVGTQTDSDSAAGSDTVVFRIDAPADQGPYQVDVRLYYQVLEARYAAELFTRDVPEMKLLRTRYNEVAS